jgi:hypothetical protein
VQYSLKLVDLFNSVGDPDPPDSHVFGPPGSGSISQRSLDPDPGLDQDPDPHQNVTDPQHCFKPTNLFYYEA